MLIRVRDTYGKDVCLFRVVPEYDSFTGKIKCVVDEGHMRDCWLGDIDGDEETVYRIDIENPAVSEIPTAALIDELRNRCE